MPFQSIFINAFQNDIANNQLWQQTAAGLQTNKFVQVIFFFLKRTVSECIARKYMYF